jgi:ferritin-like metal-binding protein YciE
MNERDEKLVEWLREAHSKESELEADLAAHIGLTTKDSYKKRLRQHLTETRAHKRKVASRIKKLSGSAPGSSVPGAGVIGGVAGKAVAAVKGQVGTARALITAQVETHLRNAQEELREEHVEIALYSRIEVFANEVGDLETAQLAKEIKREEERMAKFLEAEMPRLVKELVRTKIPREQRAAASARAGARGRSARPRSAAQAKSPRSGPRTQTPRREAHRAGTTRK